MSMGLFLGRRPLYLSPWDVPHPGALFSGTAWMWLHHFGAGAGDRIPANHAAWDRSYRIVVMALIAFEWRKYRGLQAFVRMAGINIRWNVINFPQKKQKIIEV